ncbi:competence type IV pilus minor pilin ComGE [Neobacillus sp.]|uniref:competence type IV pilus minor pilin ComGE n=1 Tax=Neobacillus sp. TaxID=2675273 RepID=UPI0037C739D1
MLRNNKGFFLLELLLSLSALIMLSLFLLPLLMELRGQSIKLEIENRTRQIMYEELQAKLIENQTFVNYTLRQNRVEYKIIWKDSRAAGQMEVCVKVERNAFLPQTEICGLLE